MMYRPHPEFTPPSDTNQKVWRYVDFPKFVSMLLSKSLFFCRADRLGDPFEGSISLASVAAREEFYRKLKETQELPDSAIEYLRKADPKMMEDIRKIIFVNSWNMSEIESPALWHEYSRDSKGVAIQSTYQRLTDSFRATELGVNVGVIHYVDYETDFIPQKNLLTPVLHKRHAFAHERELRAVIMKAPVRPNKTVENEAIESTKGILVAVDLDTLVERVYVSPASPDWFADLVRDAAPKLGLPKMEIVRSRLAARPTF